MKRILLTMICVAYPAGFASELVAEDAKTDVWVGPSPFVQVEHTPESFSRKVRTDFVPVLCDPNGWQNRT